MSAEESYLEMINILRDINPKMCRVLEYLRPYYVYHRVPAKRQEAIELINNRHQGKTLFENYYPHFFEQMPKYEEYSDKREFCTALGKYNLAMVLKENPEFKDEYDKLILKIENISKGRNYQTSKRILDQLMMQMVYRCADMNALYWGCLTYTTEIYKFLSDKAVHEIKEYKKQNEEDVNISKKN